MSDEVSIGEEEREAVDEGGDKGSVAMDVRVREPTTPVSDRVKEAVVGGDVGPEAETTTVPGQP